MDVRRPFFVTIFTSFSIPLLAADVALTGEYLIGKWSSDGKQGCTSTAADYVTFHGNGVIEAGRGVSPEAVGFWSAKGDEITVHLLVAPQVSATPNVFYRGRYTYSHVAVNVLATRPGAFDVVTGPTGNMEKRTWTKCD